MAEKLAEQRKWQTPSNQIKRVKIVTTGIIAAAVLGPLSLVLTLVQSPPPPPPSYQPPVYLAAASTVAQAWVKGAPSPIPRNNGVDIFMGRGTSRGDTSPLDIKNLSWAGYTPLPTETLFPNEQHTFVGTLNERNVNVEITILGSDIGPVLGSVPFMRPAAYVPQEQNVNIVTFGEPVEISSGTKGQLERWAQAYGRNDSQEIFRLTGDRENRVYVGLPGGNYNVLSPERDVTILNNIGIEAPNGQVFVRATITFTPFTLEESVTENPTGPNQVEIIEVSQPRQSFTLSFDILLSDPSAALPSIVAWGPPGSGPDLEPYQNAINENIPRSAVNLFLGNEQGVVREGDVLEGELDEEQNGNPGDGNDGSEGPPDDPFLVNQPEPPPPEDPAPEQ